MRPQRYRSLDPHQLERTVAEDLRHGLGKRGAEVRHIGGPGNPDIVVDAGAFVVVVEVASRTGAAAAEEYLAIREHRDAVARKEGRPTHLLFTCWSSPARLIRAVREDNSARSARGEDGRTLFLDLRALEWVLARLAETSRELYENDRWREWFALWEQIGDDVVALETLQQTVFREDQPLRDLVTTLVEERTQLEQEALRKDVRKLEDLLRHRNVTRNDAMQVLVYIAFLKLYEEKREARGEHNRFTAESFPRYRDKLSAKAAREYAGRTVQHLLENEIALDPEVQAAGLLEGADLPRQVNDAFIEGEVLERLDRYRFRGTHLDALGAVFEALARRAEKDTRIGQFFTPEPIVRFAVDVCRPGPTETVLDPAAGTGRFLTFSMERMRRHAPEVRGVPTEEVVRAIHESRLLGTDADRWIVTIAKMNMYIHGDGKSNIVRENGLFLADLEAFPRRAGPLLGQVDVCVTNPPLGDLDYRAFADDLGEREGVGISPQQWLAERLPILPGWYSEERRIADAETRIASWEERYRAAVQRGDAAAEKKALRYRRLNENARAEAAATLAAGGGSYRVSGNTAKGGALFLAAIRDYLKAVADPSAPEEWKGGRLAIVVDEAILNTPEYAATRRFVRTHFFVKAVFSFYRDAFWYQARTTAKTSLLYLYRKPDPSVKQTEPVFYCHFDRIGFTRTGKPDENELPMALASYSAFEAALRASYRGPYFDVDEARRRVDVLTLPAAARLAWATSDTDPGARMDYAYEAARQIRAALPESHLVLRDLVVPVRRHPPEDPLGIYAFATVDRNTGEVRPARVTDTAYRTGDLLVLRPGDIVLSGMDLVNGSVGYAREDVADQVVSKEFYVLRVRPEQAHELDPRFLALFLRTHHVRELVAGTVTGTSNRTRIEDEAALLDLPLPDLPPLAVQRAMADEVENALNLRRRARRILNATLRNADTFWTGSTVETLA